MKDDLDALLSLGDVRAEEVLALVPSLVSASGGEVPEAARPLLARFARAAGVRDDDDDATVESKIRAFVAANTRDEVKRGLFALAAGRAIDLVREGAQAALSRFTDERGPVKPTPNEPPSGKNQGMSALDLRAARPDSDRAKGSD